MKAITLILWWILIAVTFPLILMPAFTLGLWIDDAFNAPDWVSIVAAGWLALCTVFLPLSFFGEDND